MPKTPKHPVDPQTILSIRAPLQMKAKSKLKKKLFKVPAMQD